MNGIFANQRMIDADDEVASSKLMLNKESVLGYSEKSKNGTILE